MASASGSSILSRARVVASQTVTDANQSTVIDSLGGLRALLNNCVRELYRRYSNNQKFIQDTVTKHTIAIGSGSGTLPDEVMREFLHQANFGDDNNSLISYYKYPMDAESGVTFSQLGVAWVVGDTIYYTAPAPDLSDYSGSLFVTVPTFPTFPSDMTDDITFPSESVIDDLALMLAQAIVGNEKFQVVSV